MTNEDAAPQPEIDHEGLHDDEFTVALPAVPGEEPTHVVHLRGDEVAFGDALTGFLQAGSEASEPLRRPVEPGSLDHLVDLLNGLGGAVVERIDAR